MDAITDPLNSTLDHIASTGSSRDDQQFADQVSDVQMLTATLQEVAQNATMGSVTGLEFILIVINFTHFRCSDPEVIKLVTVTASKIEKLFAKLIDCAKAVTTASSTSERNTAVEQFTLVKYNWNSNVSPPYSFSTLGSCILLYTGSTSYCSCG